MNACGEHVIPESTCTIRLCLVKQESSSFRARCVQDGEQIVKLLNQNSKFVIDLMTTSFFEDCEPVLTEIEAKEYLC